MKIISTKFSGLKVIQSKSYKDNRGLFKEDYKKKFFKKKILFLDVRQVQKKMLLEDCTYKQNIHKKNMFQS